MKTGRKILAAAGIVILMVIVLAVPRGRFSPPASPVPDENVEIDGKPVPDPCLEADPESRVGLARAEVIAVEDTNDLGERADTATRDLAGEAEERIDAEKEDLLQKDGEKQQEALGAGRAELERRQKEADRILQEAETRAESVRSDARRAAERIRNEGYARARQVESARKDPAARQAARTAADRIRREADSRAQQTIAEGDRKADDILDEGRKKASAVLGG